MTPRPAQPRSRVVVVGQGYVGLPLAIRSVEVGHEVVGYDTDPGRIKRLEAGDSFVEDISAAQLRRALDSGRYQPTADPAGLADFDVAIVTVPTPLRDGNPDLTYIQAAAVTLSAHLRPGATVILESTTYPGTTEELVAPLLAAGSGLEPGADFHLGYSPERIDPGNPTHGLVNTPKVVSGIDAASLAAVERFYSSVVDRTVAVSGTREAELVKLLENTFRHVNVALVNELAMFASDLGIDVWEAIAAAATKPFGFMPFTPGPGVGGHCLPIDPSYLSWRVKRMLGQPFRFVELANDVNDHMPDYVVRRLVVALNRRRQAVNGSRILLLGLSYKRNTSDDRESPAIAVADRLLRLGAEVRAADPHAGEDHTPTGVIRVDLSPAELAAADTVVVLTDHDAFDYAMVTAHARSIFDTRHRLEPGPTVEFL
ncbi:MAG: nucleotide sugar dehydrogenase [Acidimicrobiales bacterium]